MRPVPQGLRTSAGLACAALAVPLLAACSGSSADAGSGEADREEAFCAAFDALPPPTEFGRWQQAWTELAEDPALDGLPARVVDGVALQADLAATALTARGAEALEKDLIEREADALDALREFVAEEC